MPPERGGEAAVVRLVALVVAPSLPDAAIVAALRQRIDAAFLPRRIVRVGALPRYPTPIAGCEPDRAALRRRPPRLSRPLSRPAAGAGCAAARRGAGSRTG